MPKEFKRLTEGLQRGMVHIWNANDFDAYFKTYKPTAASWHTALQEAATRRQFPNLLFAERWLTCLARAGMFPGSWRRNSE